MRTLRSILKLYVGSGDSLMGRLADLLSPMRLDRCDKKEPWRLGVKPKPIIYHEPLINLKFIKLFKGVHFAIGDKSCV